ncbi:stage II sporulation protein D [uncultured Clostridium sp.]|uniref:stage II sporulation protein D n=1 Tax=uncultured Clostridium sp. TaxID=59620 RepID=UPI0026737FFF|nr:stage II sporulation protein D [uncultured Clostridium sp.]
MAKQLKGILFTTLAIIVFMIAMPIFIMKPKVSAKISTNDVEKITDTNEVVEASTKQNNNIIMKGNEIIRVYITETGEIEEVNLEDYICGVVSNEMPANFEKEALKAQAVTARTYLASKKLNRCTLHEGIDICDSTHCQVYTSKEKRLEKWGADYANEYWNKIKEAVDETSGQVLSYEGELVLYPQFFSTSSGQTENSEDVYLGEIPYLRSVASTGEESAPKYTSDKTLKISDFVYLLNSNFTNLNVTVENIKNNFNIKSSSAAGGVIKLNINNVEIRGVDFRKALSLNSTNFTYEFNGDYITFHCKGYGHGVGMSQWGANAMAKNGSNYEEILKHYYSGVEITNLELTE